MRERLCSFYVTFAEALILCYNEYVFIMDIKGDCMHTIDRGLKENFFQWKGRLNRKRYLKRMLALWIPGIAMLGHGDRSRRKYGCALSERRATSIL